MATRAAALLAPPVAEDEEPPPEPAGWPAVAVLVPARNEAEHLPVTLPSLLAQDYPGERRVIVVDDRSDDGTEEIARGLGAEAVAGAPLPDGWVGKVWALEQGARLLGREEYVLLSDADVRHDRGSLRRLVAESEAGRLALNSRLARLRCVYRAEKLLIPPFVFFFNLLYPMRRVNDPRDPLAAAAGGCVLLRRDALERIGGFAAIRGEVIDDVNLARRVKSLGEPIRLTLSRGEVESLRAHDLAGAWRMVRRTAFTELRRSWLRLAVAVALLPPASLVLVPAFLPTVRYFRLNPLRALTLPLAAILYAGMTLDSALRGGGRW